MTDLSPAAQAVLDAFSADDYGVCLEGDPDRIAAALKALADQAADLQIPWSYTGDSYQIYDEGLHAAAEHLRAIAAELDGKTAPTKS